MMCQKIWNRLAPSIVAASSSDFGIPLNVPW
jgi:hypothetical protein